jgi:hypothetical protein
MLYIHWPGLIMLFFKLVTHRVCQFVKIERLRCKHLFGHLGHKPLQISWNENCWWSFLCPVWSPLKMFFFVVVVKILQIAWLPSTKKSPNCKNIFIALFRVWWPPSLPVWQWRLNCDCGPGVHHTHPRELQGRNLVGFSVWEIFPNALCLLIWNKTS